MHFVHNEHKKQSLNNWLYVYYLPICVCVCVSAYVFQLQNHFTDFDLITRQRYATAK